jgi:hypothetical protein
MFCLLLSVRLILILINIQATQVFHLLYLQHLLIAVTGVNKLKNRRKVMSNKYKAKPSYAGLSSLENASCIGMTEHIHLLNGNEVEIKEMPEGLEKHLEPVGVKKNKKKSEV